MSAPHTHIRLRRRQGSQLLQYLFNITVEALANIITQQKRKKDIQTWTKEVKLPLFIDYVTMSMYVEYLMESTKKLVKIIRV